MHRNQKNENRFSNVEGARPLLHIEVASKDGPTLRAREAKAPASNLVDEANSDMHIATQSLGRRGRIPLILVAHGFRYLEGKGKSKRAAPRSLLPRNSDLSVRSVIRRLRLSLLHTI